MKQVIGILAAGLVLAGLWGGLSIRGLAQSPAVQQPPRVFRYAYVTPIDRPRIGAEICYAEPTGCRLELVTVQPVEFGAILGSIDTAATASRAMAKAVRELGQGRWEMIGSGPAYGHAREATAVHFRRAE